MHCVPIFLRISPLELRSVGVLKEVGCVRCVDVCMTWVCQHAASLVLCAVGVGLVLAGLATDERARMPSEEKLWGRRVAGEEGIASPRAIDQAWAAATAAAGRVNGSKLRVMTYNIQHWVGRQLATHMSPLICHIGCHATQETWVPTCIG